ncbi:MAG TPA: hypothetical protein VHB77_20015, partial [Planctomycetaceae bacterium]|nr:hypothetical protein [Planctomycetaceae bacterium]
MNFQAQQPNVAPDLTRWQKVLLFSCVALLLLWMAFEILSLDLMLHLALGWISFLTTHVLAATSSAAKVAVVLLVLVALGLHAAGTEMYRTKGRWQLRWTLELVLAAGMIFAAGAAFLGIGRQM